jgi:hypothetical protein
MENKDSNNNKTRIQSWENGKLIDFATKSDTAVVKRKSPN